MRKTDADCFVQVPGGLSLTLSGHTFTLVPPSVGVGAVGLSFALDGRRFLNLGDTLLPEERHAWRDGCPDVLVVPVGGMMTMDVDHALRALEAIQPRLAIPVHHNWDILCSDNDSFACAGPSAAGDPRGTVRHWRALSSLVASQGS